MENERESDITDSFIATHHVIGYFSFRYILPPIIINILILPISSTNPKPGEHSWLL